MTESRPLSIAAVTCNLLLGGATTFLVNFLQVLRNRPETLQVVGVTDVNDHSADFEKLGAKVCTTTVRDTIYEDRLAWAYATLAEREPDAVLACLGAESFEMLRLTPPGVARIGIIQSHDPMPYAMARRYGAWVDAMVGVSREICDQLKAIPEFAGKRIEHIPYGIHFPEPLVRQPRNPNEPLRVLYLGRIIEEQKRISRLVELIHLMEAGTIPVHFTIVGSGPDEAAFQSAVANSKITSVVGAIPNSQVAEVLRSQDVYILLSDYEGLPLSLLESMGAGLVPVVSDLSSGIDEAVDQNVGIRVPVGDVAQAAAALRTLANDPEHLARFSSAAAERARSCYSANAMVARYLELINSLTASQARPTWSKSVRIPTPLGLNPFLFARPGRQLRRWFKERSRLRASQRGSSSRE